MADKELIARYLKEGKTGSEIIALMKPDVVQAQEVSRIRKQLGMPDGRKRTESSKSAVIREVLEKNPAATNDQLHAALIAKFGSGAHNSLYAMLRRAAGIPQAHHARKGKRKVKRKVKRKLATAAPKARVKQTTTVSTAPKAPTHRTLSDEDPDALIAMQGGLSNAFIRACHAVQEMLETNNVTKVTITSKGVQVGRWQEIEI